MKEILALKLINILQVVLLMSLSLQECCCSPLNNLKSSVITDMRRDDLLPMISPTTTPQPLIPLGTPSSPLTPFTNNTTPKLSGNCLLNFDTVDEMMSTASTDCMTTFAPFLANVMCCPQLETTLTVLIGQSSNNTKKLALNVTQAKHCLSDFEQILVGQGADNNLKKICSVQPSNLTSASCPVIDVDTFEKTVDFTKLLSSCEKIDLVNECCSQVCHNAIAEAAEKLALRSYELLSVDGSHKMSDHSSEVDDCTVIVHRWLASKLDPSRAKHILRGLSNCKINNVCPLVFPNMSSVAKHCGNEINKSNYTACCNAFESFMSHLQLQSFVTNLQALNCAASLGIKLQKANVSVNVYNLCHVSLKDFSLQANSQGTGCLLPSLPSDATLDRNTGIGFVCDLNDNIPAPWPSASLLPISSCNKTIKIPALPAATSGESGIYSRDAVIYKLFATLVLLLIVV